MATRGAIAFLFLVWASCEELAQAFVVHYTLFDIATSKFDSTSLSVTSLRESISPEPSEASTSASNARTRSKAPNGTPKAPLVDSDLLRFLSTQKKQIVVQSLSETTTRPKRPFSGDSLGYFRKDDSVNGSSVALGESIDEGNQISLSEAGLEAPRAEDGTSFTSDDRVSDVVDERQSDRTGEGMVAETPWLFQYNSHRIAQQLVALGVDEAAAFHAGQIVQSHALARMTRRRIRKFLQVRDAQWAAGVPGGQLTFAGRIGGVDDKGGIISETHSVESTIGVLTDFGLSGNDVAAIFSHTPSVAMMLARRELVTHKDDVMVSSGDGAVSLFENSTKASVEQCDKKVPVSSMGGETLEQTLKRSFVGLLCNTLKLRKYDARKILRTCPGLLTKRGSMSAEQVVELMTTLGASTSSLARYKTSLPTLLSRSPASLFRLVAFLSSNYLRVPVERIGPLMRRSDCAELLNIVAPVKTTQRVRQCGAGLLDDYDEYDDQRDRINEVYQTMATNANVLRHDIGIDDFGKVLSSWPSVLLSNSSQIVSVAHYLRDEIGICDGDVSKILQAYPSLMGIEVAQMERVVAYLISLEVSEDALGSIFRSFPSLLALDIEQKMIPVVDFLRGIGVVNVGRFVTRLPPVLGYSVEKELKPKWDFLKDVCQEDSFEVVRFPAFFSYPLDRVIMARYEYLRDVKQIPIQLVSLDDVLRFGDVDFATLIACDDDGGAAFAKFAKLRKERKVDSRNKKRSHNNRRQNRR